MVPSFRRRNWDGVMFIPNIVLGKVDSKDNNQSGNEHTDLVFHAYSFFNYFNVMILFCLDGIERRLR